MCSFFSELAIKCRRAIIEKQKKKMGEKRLVVIPVPVLTAPWFVSILHLSFFKMPGIPNRESTLLILSIGTLKAGYTEH